MKFARTADGLNHRNTLVFNTVKVYFQLYPGKDGSDADRGIAGLEWKLHGGGRVVAMGTTEADGSLTVAVPAGITTELEILGSRYTLKVVRSLEAVTTVEGKQRRLSLLGYELGGVDGSWGHKSNKATLNFQANRGLNPDGEVGPTTQGSLTSQFGE